MRIQARLVLAGLFGSAAACSSGWREPQRIEARSSDAYNVPMVASGSGLSSGLLVLGYRGPAVKGSHFVANWALPATLGAGRVHAVAKSSDGTGMALFGSTTANGAAARFAASTWEAASAFAERFGGWPDIGADASGNFVAAWPAAAGNNVHASLYRAGGGWQPVRPIGHATPPVSVTSVSVAVNRTGSAVVAWCEARASGAAVVANIFVPSSGWGAATDLGTMPRCVDTADSEFWPNVSTVDSGITDLGVATAAWAASGRMHVRRYAPGVGWAPTESLTAAGAAINPKVAVSRSRGDILVAWKETGAAVHARRYSAASGFWTPDTALGGSGAIRTLAVGIDDSGRGMVAFPAVNPAGIGWVAAAVRFDGTFQPVEYVGMLEPTAYELDLSMTDDGYAFLVWTHRLRDVWGAVYFP